MTGVITVVSGLPRCGTSMMMRILEAGDTSIDTDKQVSIPLNLTSVLWWDGYE